MAVMTTQSSNAPALTEESIGERYQLTSEGFRGNGPLEKHQPDHCRLSSSPWQTHKSNLQRLNNRSRQSTNAAGGGQFQDRFITRTHQQSEMTSGQPNKKKDSQLIHEQNPSGRNFKQKSLSLHKIQQQLQTPQRPSLSQMIREDEMKTALREHKKMLEKQRQAQKAEYGKKIHQLNTNYRNKLEKMHRSEHVQRSIPQSNNQQLAWQSQNLNNSQLYENENSSSLNNYVNQTVQLGQSMPKTGYKSTQQNFNMTLPLSNNQINSQSLQTTPFVQRVPGQFHSRINEADGVVNQGEEFDNGILLDNPTSYLPQKRKDPNNTVSSTIGPLAAPVLESRQIKSSQGPRTGPISKLRNRLVIKDKQIEGFVSSKGSFSRETMVASQKADALNKLDIKQSLKSEDRQSINLQISKERIQNPQHAYDSPGTNKKISNLKGVSRASRSINGIVTGPSIRIKNFGIKQQRTGSINMSEVPVFQKQDDYLINERHKQRQIENLKGSIFKVEFKPNYTKKIDGNALTSHEFEMIAEHDFMQSQKSATDERPSQKNGRTFSVESCVKQPGDERPESIDPLSKRTAYSNYSLTKKNKININTQQIKLNAGKQAGHSGTQKDVFGMPLDQLDLTDLLPSEFMALHSINPKIIRLNTDL